MSSILLKITYVKSHIEKRRLQIKFMKHIMIDMNKDNFKFSRRIKKEKLKMKKKLIFKSIIYNYTR